MSCAGNIDDKWTTIRDAVRDAGQEVFADSPGTGTLASKERLAALNARRLVAFTIHLSSRTTCTID
eukprot:7615845-Heterocapsa_arctica.AAC.1